MGPVRDSAEAGALLSITLNFRYSAAKAAVVGYRLAWPTTRRRAIHPPTASAFAYPAAGYSRITPPRAKPAVEPVGGRTHRPGSEYQRHRCGAGFTITPNKYWA